MGFFDVIKDTALSALSAKSMGGVFEMCPPRPLCEKKDGSQDHRCNTGNSRTPAQKEGDKKRTK
jgi:hypothetical protein